MEGNQWIMVFRRSRQERTEEEGTGFIAAEMRSSFGGMMGGKPGCGGMFNETELRK